MTTTSNDTTYRVIKTAQCGKICTQDKPELTYEISQHTVSNAFFIHISKNSVGGFFSNQWIPIEDIIGCIAEYGPGLPFKALIFRSLYESTGANNHGFLAAALRSEGLVAPYEKGIYNHTQGDIEGFKEGLEKLAKTKPIKKAPPKKTVVRKVKPKAASKRSPRSLAKC